MPFFKSIYLIFSEDRVKEMLKFESIINENYPTLIINKYFNLHDSFEMLNSPGMMAPDYIFVEDLHMTDGTYNSLRKICRLEKLSESKIVIFGSGTERLNKAKLINYKVKMLAIPDYNNIDIRDISKTLKEAFSKTLY